MIQNLWSFYNEFLFSRLLLIENQTNFSYMNRDICLLKQTNVLGLLRVAWLTDAGVWGLLITKRKNTENSWYNEINEFALPNFIHSKIFHG